MTVTSGRGASTTGGTCRIRYEVVDRRLTELGDATDTERGERLGVTRQTVLRWRHGHTGVSLATAMRVAEAIGVRLDQLVEAGE